MNHDISLTMLLFLDIPATGKRAATGGWQGPSGVLFPMAKWLKISRRLAPERSATRFSRYRLPGGKT